MQYGKGSKEKADDRNSDLSHFRIIFTSGSKNEGKKRPAQTSIGNLSNC